MRKSKFLTLLLILISCSILVYLAACTKPFLEERHQWKTPVEKCSSCHQKDSAFKIPEIKKHADIHCLECHTLSKDHSKYQNQPFDGKYDNLVIREDRCIVCHPTDRYSNAGHWRHLGVRASYQGKPMQCTSCHVNGHALKIAGDCNVCHAETAEKAQPMATGHCVICHGFQRTTFEMSQEEFHPFDLAVCKACHAIKGEEGLKQPDSFDSILMDPHIAKSSCAVCHSPHSKSDPGAELTCRRCHTEEEHLLVPAHTIPGHQNAGCTDCHKPHNFKSGGCQTCHVGGESPIATIEGHRKCADCHTDNDYSTFRSDSCASCHKAAGMETKSTTAGHKNCNSCHIPHKWDKSVSCARCHSSEAKLCSTSSSKKNCLLCHDSHKWTATWESCSNCHKNMKNDMHMKHFDFGCASCHAGHKWLPGERTTCLTCHPDKEKDHFDDTMACVECHPFK
jgi:hypothetical protein